MRYWVFLKYSLMRHDIINNFAIIDVAVNSENTHDIEYITNIAYWKLYKQLNANKSDVNICKNYTHIIKAPY